VERRASSSSSASKSLPKAYSYAACVFAKPAFVGNRSSGNCDRLCSMPKSQRGAPDDPRLVKIWMTPLDASVP